MTTQAESFAAAAEALAAMFAEQDERSPYEAAVAAWRPGGPPVDELEARIRTRRGMPVAAERDVA